MNKSKLTKYVSQENIATVVRRLAGEISSYYYNKNPILIGVLKGSFIFMADLVRLLDFPLSVDFITLSSYGQGMTSKGGVTVVQDTHSQVKGREVLIIEDIVDTGVTTSFLIKHLQEQNPASLGLCALMNKDEVQGRVPVTIDYLGFVVPNKFVVGYGLDYGEQYRNLPDICILEEKNGG